MVYHEVQYGQTLWTIAIGYGVKMDEIRALNNLEIGTDIYPGGKLLVKKVAPPAVVIATLEISTDFTDAGNAVGIVLVALAFAGMLTWMGSRRSD